MPSLSLLATTSARLCRAGPSDASRFRKVAQVC
jgi:hypothetical protein